MPAIDRSVVIAWPIVRRSPRSLDFLEQRDREYRGVIEQRLRPRRYRLLVVVDNARGARRD